jgi:hypothetical protein
MIIILSLLKALGLIAGAETHIKRQPHRAEVALVRAIPGDASATIAFSTQAAANLNFGNALFDKVKTGLAHPFAAFPPAKRQLPAELATTWYTGALPLIDFYDPATGSWRAQNGLGETYTFSANGDYTYTAFLRLQNGLCLSEVSSYRAGKAQVVEGLLTLTPSVAKTRTAIDCGSKSRSTINGPFDAMTIEYAIAERPDGQVQLILTSSGSSTVFLRDGMAESLGLRSGDTNQVVPALHLNIAVPPRFKCRDADTA